MVLFLVLALAGASIAAAAAWHAVDMWFPSHRAIRFVTHAALLMALLVFLFVVVIQWVSVPTVLG